MSIGLIIDIVAGIILGIYTIVGLAKGFLNTLVSLFGNIASITVAIIAAKPFANFINSIFNVAGWFGNMVGTSLETILPEITSAQTGTQIIETLSADGVTFLERILIRFIDPTLTYNTTAELTTALQNPIGGLLTIIAAGFVLFILIRIAVAILAKLFDAISKSHAFGGLDHLLGAVIGAAKGAIFLGAILCVAFLIIQIPVVGDFITGYIEQTTFLKWGYGYIQQFMNWVGTKVDIGAIIDSII